MGTDSLKLHSHNKVQKVCYYISYYNGYCSNYISKCLNIYSFQIKQGQKQQKEVSFNKVRTWKINTVELILKSVIYVYDHLSYYIIVVI